MDQRQELVWRSIQHSRVVLNLPYFAGHEFDPGRAQLAKAEKAIAKLVGIQRYDSHPGVDSGAIVRLKQELRRKLLRVSRNGALVLEGMPGVEDDLRVPHANAKTADLIDAATRIAKNARPHAATLVRAGLPKNFIKQIEISAGALATRTASTDTVISRRSRATRSLPDALRHGRRVIMAIDASVKSELAGNRSALRHWDDAKRIPARMGRPKKKRRKPPENDPS
jgi:hypothetical protein